MCALTLAAWEFALQTQDKRKPNILLFAVVIFAIYTVAVRLPQVAYYWLPEGDLGIRGVSGAGLVGQIVPHSAAMDAGIAVGDQIETNHLDLHERLALGGPNLRPGEAVRLLVVHNGDERAVALVARPVHLTAAEIKRDLLWEITLLLRVILGATVVLLRPGRLTWLFYAWNVSGGDASDFFYHLPAGLLIVSLLPYTALLGAVSFAGVLFCLVFPNDELSGWRRRVFPFVVAALSVCIAFELARFAALIFNINTASTDWILYVEDAVAGVFGTAVLVAYYVQSTNDRARVRGLIVMLVIGFMFEVAGDLFSVIPSTTAPSYFGSLQYTWALLITIAFAYMIIRYRLFDVEFVLSRALVYSLLAVAAIGIFVAIDAAFTSRFHGSRVEVAVDIAVALGIGFWVKAIHGRVIDLVDRALFRRRYESRMRLKAAFGMLAGADSTRAVEEIVTSGAATALGLASAVFFRRVADGGLLREIGFGWPPDAVWHMLPDDILVTTLERRAPPSIDLQKLGWSRAGISPPHQPVVAIPLISVGRVIGVTLYGSRLNGVLPSPDEVSGLIALMHRATSAYVVLDSLRSKIPARDASARISP